MVSFMMPTDLHHVLMLKYQLTLRVPIFLQLVFILTIKDVSNPYLEFIVGNYF